MSDPDAAPALTLALGRSDDMRAEAFVRVATCEDGHPGAVTGTITGPRRGRDTTLPVTARLQPTGTAGIARAILTEPAYWTPDLPNLYRLEATVESGAAPPRSIDRLVGLRRLGVRGRSLWLDGHRWVPRAVRVAGPAGIDACKPAALAALITEPDAATLARADEIGVAVLALVLASPTDDPTSAADRIAMWSAHPSAILAILAADVPAATAAEIAAAVRPRKDTLLLAAEVAGRHPAPATIPPGIDVLIVSLDASATPHDTWRSGTGAPLLAWRHEAAAAIAGRAPCDALQAALATWGAAGGRATPPWDWGGYVVA